MGNYIFFREKSASIVLGVSKGGDTNSLLNTFIPRLKKKNFNRTFHRKLEKYFPDWEDRMAYQKNQEEFYKSAMRKKRELRKLKIKENYNYYTKEELDAINYFYGNDFYEKYQDPKVRPNIYDTRQTFLLKMHDRTLRTNFLNSFNR